MQPLPTFDGGALIDIADREALYRAMDEAPALRAVRVDPIRVIRRE